MLELAEMQRMLQEIVDLMKSGSKADRRKAAVKLQTVAGIATTLGFTIQPRL